MYLSCQQRIYIYDQQYIPSKATEIYYSNGCGYHCKNFKLNVHLSARELWNRILEEKWLSDDSTREDKNYIRESWHPFYCIKCTLHVTEGNSERTENLIFFFFPRQGERRFHKPCIISDESILDSETKNILVSLCEDGIATDVAKTTPHGH